MSAPDHGQIDLYRIRELLRTAGTLREPNWRSMLTPGGEAAQQELRKLWMRLLTVLELNDRLISRSENVDYGEGAANRSDDGPLGQASDGDGHESGMAASVVPDPKGDER